jgi:hypothetical protein
MTALAMSLRLVNSIIALAATLFSLLLAILMRSMTR